MADTKKILIIEDDEFLLRMYATKLGMEGYKVILASDGEKGLCLAIKEKPDLILLDLLLPKKDGFEVLKELKAKVETKGIPVLVLTNLGQKQDIDRCFALGVTDYLIKAHFIPSEVIVKINRILEKF
jgi:DNA-binding response OmpR family regulator